MSKNELSVGWVRLGAIGLFLFVFVAGAITGVAVYRWQWLGAPRADMLPHPGEMGLRLHRLNLTEEQRTQIRAVFENYRPKLDAVLRETFPKVRAVQELIDADIVKLLTEKQRLQFIELGKRGGPPGFHSGGPNPFTDRPPMPPPGMPELSALPMPPPPPGMGGN